MDNNKKNQVLILNQPANPPKELKRQATVNEPLLSNLKEMFDMFDSDGDGKVMSKEIKSLLISLGREPTNQEVEDMVKEIDRDETGTIDYEEFSDYMQSHYQLEETTLEDVVDAFKVFDIDQDGKISKEEFKTILMKFEGEFTDSDIDMIFDEVETDGDGKLTYAEFVDLWKYR
jgi:calmodulin